MTAEALSRAGMSVSWNAYPNMGHTADPQEIGDLARFIEGVLKQRDQIRRESI